MALVQGMEESEVVSHGLRGHSGFEDVERGIEHEGVFEGVAGLVVGGGWVLGGCGGGEEGYVEGVVLWLGQNLNGLGLVRRQGC